MVRSKIHSIELAQKTSFVLAFVFIRLVLPLGAIAQDVEFTDLHSVRTADPIKSIGALVDFEATVTYVSGMQEFIFVQAGTDAIFVYKPNVGNIEPGHQVRVRGRLAKGDLLPIISESEVDVIGKAELPPPEQVAEIGVEHDCRFLKFEFDILQSRNGVSETMLYAKTEDNRDVSIEVRHPDGIESPAFRKIAGHRVQLSGVLGLKIEGGAFREPGTPGNQIVGYKIFCHSSNLVEALNEGIEESMASAKSVGLSFVNDDSYPEGRFMTFGQICLVEYTQPPALVVGDGSKFVRFNIHSTDALKPGMVMRIGGTKTIDSSGVTHLDVDYLCDLTQAEFPTTQVYSVQQAIDTFSPNRRISIEGTPLRIDSLNGDQALILSEGKATVKVRFQDDAFDALSSLDPKIASRVRVTGIGKADSKHGLELVVARANDAKLVKSKASFSRVVIAGLGILLTICALAALWIKQLQSQVTQKRRFESIFDNAGCPIIVFGGDLQIDDANQLTADMTGYSKEELRCMSIAQLDKVLSPQMIKSMLCQTMKSEEIAIFPTKISFKDGKTLDVEVHSRNLTKSKDVSRATFIAILHDTTARKKYENELKEARDEAIKANKAKSRFVASMSHELRTPLNGVIGMTQLLENTELTPIQADYLAACRASGETLLTVIGDVLDFSKMEADKVELEPSETKLIPFIENVVRATSLQKAARDVDLVSFVDPKLSRTVLVDSDRLRQVIFNLLGNAVKFTSEGSITVTARCNEVTSRYVDVRFIVADTGIGIPQERIEGLFEAFEQCDSSTTRRFGGTGLGLTICKQIVELMDGQIFAESVEGQGSRFIVDVQLPFAHQSEIEFDTNGERNFAATKQPVAVVGMRDPVTNILCELFAAYQVEASCFKSLDLVPRGKFETVLFSSRETVAVAEGFLENRPDWLSTKRTNFIPVVPANCIVEPAEWTRLGIAKPIYEPLSQTRILEALAGRSENEEAFEKNQLCPKTFEGRALRILVCEDVPVNQVFVRGICRKAGIDCVIRENGKEGIETLRDDSAFDAIFMDCHMPVMDGFEASRKIVQMVDQGLIPKIPIIALTANALSGDREKCLDSGMDDYLPKPFEIEQFLDKIHSQVQPEVLIADTMSQPVPPPVAVFNFDKLLEQFGDQEFVLDLALQFTGSFAGYQEELEASLDLQDAQLASQVAHRIKGSAGFVQAGRISAVAEELELLATGDELEQVQLQVQEMVQEFEDFTRVYLQECELHKRNGSANQRCP